MWPSLSVANQVANWANVLFIASLVVGVVSTIAIVWMANVKEGYWERARQNSDERIASLVTQGDQLRKDTAEANARAAASQLALERLKTPRTLSLEQQRLVASMISQYKGQRYRAAVASGADDGIAFWESLYRALHLAGWVYVPSGPPGVGNPMAGIPIAAAPGVEIRIDPEQFSQRTPAALALGNVLHNIPMVIEVNKDLQSHPDPAMRDVLFIVIGARVPPP